jgi:hypothetical protein
MGLYFFPEILLESKQLTVEGVPFPQIHIHPNNILIAKYENGFLSHVIHVDSDYEHRYWETEYKQGNYLKRKFYTVSKEIASKYEQ